MIWLVTLATRQRVKPLPLKAKAMLLHLLKAKAMLLHLLKATLPHQLKVKATLLHLPKAKLKLSNSQPDR